MGLLLGLLLSEPTKAQIDPEAQRIFDRYAEALGGQAAYDAIKTARTRTITEVEALGMRMEMKATFMHPNKFHVSTDVPGLGTMIQGFDGETGWSVDVIQGSRELKGAELEKLRSSINFQEGLQLAQKYSRAAVAGKNSEGLSVVACVTVLGGHEEALYFDPETGLLKMTESLEDMGEQGIVPVTTRVRDYLKHGDLVIPSLLEADMTGMGMTMRIEVQDFESNVEVDEALFKMPE